MPFRTGENVGPYRITQQLGQGGMASVFKAYHAALDRHVAIKVMHPAFLEDPQFLARFGREAKVVASLDHPNIVPVYDFADHAGQPYLVMKYIEGQTLKAVLEARSLTQAEVLHIVKSVGAALSYAHRRGVLHRDIKPSNVLLTSDGQVYLADFGLARIAEAGQSSMSGDQLLGTPHYISPEQARGERELDQGTDIYSLGIVLYQLTVGRVPFSADTPFSIIHDHIYTPLPMPRQTNPQLSETLENALLKALAKDRAHRFATVDDLVRAFEAALADQDAAAFGRQPTLARPEASAMPARRAEPARPPPHVAAVRARTRRRWPWVLGGLALTSLCLLTFVVAAARAMDSAPVEPSRSRNGVDAPSDLAPVSADAELSSAVADLREAVDRDPDDPGARLELAMMLERAGAPLEAYQEYLAAGELFLAQGDFAQAADALLGAAGARQAREVPDPWLTEMMTQALFQGAPSGEMLPRVEKARGLSPEIPNLPALEARAWVFDGQVERARRLLEGVLTQRPGDLIVQAVLVDVLQAEGRLTEAAALVGELLERPKMPDWLRDHLQNAEGTLSAP